MVIGTGKKVWVLKLLKRSSHKGTMQVESNISIEKSHLSLIATSVKKKGAKNKKETAKKTTTTITNRHQTFSLASKEKSV